MEKLVKNLTQEEVLKLCENQYGKGGCDNCPYKMFELIITMPQNNYKRDGYSVCIANYYAYGNDNSVDLETGIIKNIQGEPNENKIN